LQGHGAAGLGTLAAVDNTKGVVEIAPIHRRSSEPDICSTVPCEPTLLHHKFIKASEDARCLFLISRDRTWCWDTLVFSLTVSSFFDDRGSLRETRGPNRVCGSFRFLGCAVKPGSK
jgi:hypothetical protein